MLKVTLDIPPSEPAGLGPVVVIVALAIVAAAAVLVVLRRSRLGRT